MWILRSHLERANPLAVKRLAAALGVAPHTQGECACGACKKNVVDAVMKELARRENLSWSERARASLQSRDPGGWISAF